MSLLPFAREDRVRGNAMFSPCGLYRYRLSRWWTEDPERLVNFLMLNPSTADAERTDATLTRCVRFARDWGFDGLFLTNLYAFRATDPRDLWRAADPVGPANDDYILGIAAMSAEIVVAWGAHGAKGDRAATVLAKLREHGHRPRCLRLTKGGQPEHPLRLPANLTPIDFPGA